MEILIEEAGGSFRQLTSMTMNDTELFGYVIGEAEAVNDICIAYHQYAQMS